MTIQEMKILKNKKSAFKIYSKNKAFNIGNRELAIKKAIQNAAPKK